MMQNNQQFVILTLENLNTLLKPINNKLEEMSSLISKKTKDSNTTKGYYRNKDLQEKFGISPNTITKYRESGEIPATVIGGVYLYPIDKIDEILSNNSNY